MSASSVLAALPKPTLGKKALALIEEYPALKAIAKKDPAYVEDIASALDDASRFTERYIKPRALEVDRLAKENPEYTDWELIREGARHRLLSIITPKQLGGRGGLVVMGSLIMEEMCAGCAGLANIFGAHMLGIAPILLSCSFEHLDRYVYEMAEAEKREEPVIAAFAITEPQAGTDAEEPSFLSVSRVTSEAKRVPGGYLLNGTKCFISNGSIARYITVFMPTDRNRPLETWTCFVVDSQKPGFKVRRVERKMGQRACHAAEIAFEDYFVPDEDVLGAEGRGMQPHTLIVLGASRGPVGAIATGIARGALERFIEWADTKHDGKRPTSSELVQIAIADMKMRIQTARSMYLEAALSLEFGCSAKLLNHPLTRMVLALPRELRVSKPYLKFLRSNVGRNLVDSIVRGIMDSDELTRTFALSSMAKVVGSDTAMYVTGHCLELLGTAETPLRAELEKCFRDAKLTQIYEGTNELNLLSVYRALQSGEIRIEFP